MWKSARPRPEYSVSAPANAANLGYHTISKYPRADYVALAEQELRLDRRSRGGSLPEMLRALAESLQTEQAAVTIGAATAAGTARRSQDFGCSCKPRTTTA